MSDMTHCGKCLEKMKTLVCGGCYDRQSRELERLRKVEEAAKFAMSHIRTSTMTRDVAQIPMGRAAALIEALQSG